MAKTLIEQIEEDALDSSKSVADALRKCIALGGRAGSKELRAWASKELQGYQKPDDVPEYRIVAAPIVIDGMVPGSMIERQQISIHDLPDVAQEAGISETLRLTAGIGELEEIAHRATEKDEAVRIGLPGGATLAKLMTAELKDLTAPSSVCTGTHHPRRSSGSSIRSAPSSLNWSRRFVRTRVAFRILPATPCRTQSTWSSTERSHE